MSGDKWAGLTGKCEKLKLDILELCLPSERHISLCESVSLHDVMSYEVKRGNWNLNNCGKTLSKYPGLKM